MSDSALLGAMRKEAVAFSLEAIDASIIDQVGDASIVLLGEATHGSQEFYRVRAEISKHLIARKGFDAIAVEADWPDALRLSRFVQGIPRLDPAQPPDREVEDALSGFTRFPLWMWRNTEVVRLATWLRDHNQQFEGREDRVGFFGLDLYSLRTSMDAVVRYLSQVDPEAARRAKERYACFDHLAEDPQRYGYAATFGMKPDCEDEVVRQLVELTSGGLALAGGAHPDELFYAQQNARVAHHAEAYYRSMFAGRNESWNLRDTHMLETLEALRDYLSARKGRPARIVVWAHNSHIGDARSTEMGWEGQLNLGQLARERFGMDDTFLLGFTTHGGTVTAASDWDGATERKAIVPSMPGSLERLLHDVGLESFLIRFRDRPQLRDLLHQSDWLERAIGVIYLPQSERISHYFQARPARQFDAIIHVDTTSALRPLDKSSHWNDDEVPDTFPSGM
ncbi:erythromycin esterase family protein [Noviherbaspirillum galbum]|uniref:Erythromycin esterase family protein n=1 Tax=Noviherbaspirillum galbum TaxID=2709383 RepID=A0A6B3SK65_9BURK|nr:erythromycin esterase family protein [Noviherbaspirillum galbum]NEX61120.1 erythromycin esterase family protein [Noviherbaspirillum galbum]